MQMHEFTIILKSHRPQDLKDVIFKKMLKVRPKLDFIWLWVLSWKSAQIQEWTFGNDHIWYYLILIIHIHRLTVEWEKMLRICSAISISTWKIREEVTDVFVRLARKQLPFMGRFKACLKLYLLPGWWFFTKE